MLSEEYLAPQLRFTGEKRLDFMGEKKVSFVL